MHIPKSSDSPDILESSVLLRESHYGPPPTDRSAYLAYYYDVIHPTGGRGLMAIGDRGVTFLNGDVIEGLKYDLLREPGGPRQASIHQARMRDALLSIPKEVVEGILRPHLRPRKPPNWHEQWAGAPLLNDRSLKDLADLATGTTPGEYAFCRSYLARYARLDAGKLASVGSSA